MLCISFVIGYFMLTVFGNEGWFCCRIMLVSVIVKSYIYS